MSPIIPTIRQAQAAIIVRMPATVGRDVLLFANSFAVTISPSLGSGLLVFLGLVGWGKVLSHAHGSILYLLNRNYSDEVMRSAGWESFRRNVQFAAKSSRR